MADLSDVNNVVCHVTVQSRLELQKALVLGHRPYTLIEGFKTTVEES